MPEHPSDAQLRRLLEDESAAGDQAPAAHLEDCPECQERILALLADPEVARWLALAETAADEGTESGSAVPPSVPGYEILEEIGQGGMGRVLRGRDPDLGCYLAVKVLREAYHGQPEMRRRFRQEARITGQLQHPGIPPVHEVGTLPDGRPYFTMRLVQGRTLADLLTGPEPPRHDLSRFLTVFEQVCRTVAYAHSEGVIHRDLKPANVMVGAFGEVQVMDWGLAKVLTSPERQRGDPEETTAASLIRTALPGSAAEADGRTGVVGTPAYMAPEQARGEAEAVDERADVFGLGAILCAILTGQPPYTGAGGGGVLRQAAAGDVREALARLADCGADAELVALCRECLAPRPDDRPRDAGAVAARVGAYAAAVRERLGAAERERAAAEGRAAEAKATAAAERKARRRTAWLALAVLLLAAAGGGGAWLWQARAAEAARRREGADAAVALAMSEARLLLRQAKAAPLGDAARFREAQAAAGKARDLADTGWASDDVRRQAATLLRAVAGEAEAAARDRRLLAALRGVRGPHEGPRFRKDDRGYLVEQAEPGADEQFQAAFREWDPTFDADALPTREAASRLKERLAAVVTEVVAALDEWADERRRQGQPPARWQPLADLAAALDEDPGSGRTELRALLARGNLGRERALGALAVALRPVPVPFDAGLGDDRCRLRRLAREADTAGEPVLGLLTLARALRAAGEDDVAERLLRAAVRARPGEAVLHDALGKLLEQQRPPRWREVVECYAAARSLRPELGEALANALVNAGRVEEGLALYERLAAERPDNPWLHFRRGYVLGELGREKEAEAAVRAALRLRPDDPEAHNNLGVALGSQGRYEEAEAALREALRLKPDYPAAHVNLGNALRGQGHLKEAEEAYRAAARLAPDFATAHCNLGPVLNDQGRYAEAEAACRTALRLRAYDPGAHNNLGVALGGQGRNKEAEAALRAALRLRPDDPDVHSNLGAILSRQGRYKEAEASLREALRLRPDYPAAHNNLGSTLNHLDRPKEAAAACREALRLKPDYPEASCNLGIALSAQGRSREADAAFGEALLRLKSDSPPAHSALGNTLFSLGRFKEAEAAYRGAIRLKPDYPEAYFNLGVALDRQGRPEEAEAAYRAAVRLRPDYALAHSNLGRALLARGRFAEALESLRRGDALGGQAPGSPSPSANAIRQCERLVELDRQLPAVLRGDAEPTSAERVGFATLVQRYKGLHVAAARLYADAFTDAPGLADDWQLHHRYNAACSAALAAAGRGEDAARLPDKVVVMLRRQALRWLRADLALYAKLAPRDDPKVKAALREMLAHWQQDPDLAPVRDKEALDKLPDEERKEWRQLWEGAAALLGQAGEKK